MRLCAPLLMAEVGIPDDVRAFLDTHIHSAREVEVLLLLHRDAQRWWTPEQVNSELRTSLRSAQQCLAALVRAGLAEQQPGLEATFRFRSPDAGIELTVQLLAELFRDRMTSIVELIYKNRDRTPG